MTSRHCATGPPRTGGTCPRRGAVLGRDRDPGQGRRQRPTQLGHGRGFEECGKVRSRLATGQTSQWDVTACNAHSGYTHVFSRPPLIFTYRIVPLLTMLRIQW